MREIFRPVASSLHIRRVEADDVVAAPLLEGLVTSVERVAAIAGERVREQDVRERRIARIRHGRTVIPRAWPETRIEPRTPIAEPEVRYGLRIAPRGRVDGALGVGACRWRCRRGVPAIGHLSVGVHPCGRVARIRNLAPDAQRGGLCGECALPRDRKRAYDRAQGDKRCEQAAQGLRAGSANRCNFHVAPPIGRRARPVGPRGSGWPMPHGPPWPCRRAMRGRPPFPCRCPP